MRGPVALAAGILLGAAYATPDTYNPLVRLGLIEALTHVDDTPILMIATTIAVQPSDLPTQRPSLSTARSIDDIEAAYFVGSVPPVPAVEPISSNNEPPEVSASLNTTAAALPAPKPSGFAHPAALKKQQSPSGPDEDFNTSKQRAFKSER